MSRDAVVVGINRYQYLSNLQAPAQDAEAIAQCLHTYGEFRVNRLPEVIDQQRPKVGVTTPVTRQELETALVQLFKPRGKHIPSTALFYYSGHGLQKDAGIQEGYLATSDANPNQGMYGVSLFWLRRLLQESPVRQRIIILDCCHSGELLNFLEADPGAQPGTDRLFMAASREYESAYESLEGAYSVFTQALLAGLDPQQRGTVTNYALTSWVSDALKGELQQPLFECSGREILLTTSRGLNDLASATLVPTAEGDGTGIPVTDPCPFPGLQPLGCDTPSLLPNQAEVVQTLNDRLQTHAQVTLTGASGSGKTSLIRRAFLAQSAAHPWQCRYVTATSGEQPLHSLARIFVAETAIGVERASQHQQAIALLEQGGAGLVQLCNASWGASQGWVLIIDHLEAWLPPLGMASGHGQAGEQATPPSVYPFLAALMEASRLQPERLRILWVVRHDYGAEWTHLAQVLMPEMAMAWVTLDPPTPAAIQYCLIDGLAQIGVRLEPHLLYTLNLELRERSVALPLLQMVLRELWQRQQGETGTRPSLLTVGTYAHLDGVRGLIHRHADAVLTVLSPAEQAIAQRLFLALIHLQPRQEAMPRRIPKADLLARVQAYPQALQVLETLVTARLLVIHQPDVEISHPDLVRSWPQMRTWLADRRDVLHLQQQVEQAAQDWQHTPTALNHPDGTAWTTQAPPSVLNLPSQDRWLRGDLLTAASRHYERYPNDFSPLAQRYIALSHREQQRLRRQSRQLRTLVPLVLLLTLGAGILQYRAQVMAEQQLRVARSRERAAISQAILQDRQQDPTSALLISRLAIEQGWRTPEAQASLRGALQRLQTLVAQQGELPPLQGLTQPVRWAAFVQPEADFWPTTTLRQIPTAPTVRSQVLVTATRNGQIQYWDLQTGAALKQPFWLPLPTTADRNPSTGRSLPPPSTRAASQTSLLATTPTASPAMDNPDPLTGFALSLEGRWLATTQVSGRVNIYRLQPDQTFELIHSLPQSGRVEQLAFSPLSNRLLGIDHDRVLIWDLGTGEQVQVLQGHQGAITQARFSHDGWQVATSSWDHTIALWQVNTGTLVQRWSHQNPVTAIGFSPNDRALVFAGQDGTLAKLSLTRTGQPQVLQRLETPVMDVKYSPAGQGLITTQANGMIQFWDAKTGVEQGQLPIFATDQARSDGTSSPPPIQQVLQSPDGRYLTTLQSDGHITSWTASWESLLDLARDRSLRQLTPDECWQYLKLSAAACPVLSLGKTVEVANPIVRPRARTDLATTVAPRSPHPIQPSPLLSLTSTSKSP